MFKIQEIKCQDSHERMIICIHFSDGINIVRKFGEGRLQV